MITLSSSISITGSNIIYSANLILSRSKLTICGCTRLSSMIGYCCSAIDWTAAISAASGNGWAQRTASIISSADCSRSERQLIASGREWAAISSTDWDSWSWIISRTGDTLAAGIGISLLDCCAIGPAKVTACFRGWGWGGILGRSDYSLSRQSNTGIYFWPLLDVFWDQIS